MRYRKLMFMLVLTILIFGAASVCASDMNDTVVASDDDSAFELSQEDAGDMISSDEDELIGQRENELINEGDSGTFAELQADINAAANASTLTLNKNYECEDGFDTAGILINKTITIDGNGFKIDAQGKSRIFKIPAENVILKNIIFINGNTDGYGGAVYFHHEGTVTNCNFVDNKATGYYGYGGAICIERGAVTNCNFTGNSAGHGGGAIEMTYATVGNCNFTDNTANEGGAFRSNSGNVSNCHFTDNAANEGGAVYFFNKGAVTNCNFVNNSANLGGAIYSYQRFSLADTCIFKANSSENVNTVILSPVLSVDNFTTVHGSGDKLTFDLKTNSSSSVTDGNISISVYFKDNNTWVGNYTCLSGDGWTVNLPVGSYYAIFNTEYEGFQPVNTTITITVPQHTFWFLNNTINGNDNPVIELSNDFYFDPAYDAAFVNGIIINRTVSIKGNGSSIDAKGQARIFHVKSNGTVIENLTLKNAYANSDGGAVYFGSEGMVINCYFTNNTASSGGGAVWIYSGNVSNCNFVDNRATNDNDEGGAVRMYSGNVSNCNFTNNSAVNAGGAVWMSSGNVSNCNFANNSASVYGGAIRMQSGSVENCKFSDNSASEGGAILSMPYLGVTYDSCIFKTDSDTTYNTRNFSPTLNVDNLTTFYESGEKLTLDLRTTISNVPITNGNISISVYIKDNNSWVANYSCLSGEGWIPDLRVGSYHVIFNTEYGAFQPINRTITVIIPAGKYYANVTSLTTNNKTVNITAKTNVPENITWDGKLIFILPNGTQIDAICGADGRWWAEYTFKDYGEYKVNAAYAGMDNVTLNNGTITVSKIKTEITGAAITATYNINKYLTVTLKDDKGNPLSGADVTVVLKGAKTYTTDKNGQVKVSTKGLAPKIYTAKATFNGDAVYDKSTKDIKVTVKKATPKLTAKKKTFKRSVKVKKYSIVLKDNVGKAIKKAKVTIKIGKKTYTAKTNSKGKATFKIKKLTKKGKYKAKVSYNGNKYYNKVTKKVNIRIK